MPPKDTDQTKGMLFTEDGEQIGSFLGIPEIQEIFIEHEDGMELLPTTTTNQLEFTCSYSAINLNMTLFRWMVLGIRPSNNWLRMHGYPMRRRHK